MTVRGKRQREVADWIIDTFGLSSLRPRERARRLLEEAIELAQAEGVTREDVNTHADYIYAKEPGDPKQELGDVGLTLLAYAESRGFSADQTEVDTISDALRKSKRHWYRRHQTKIDAGMSKE